MLRVQRNRWLAAALLLVVTLFALPIVTNQTAPSSVDSATASPLPPTLPPPTATPSYQPGTVVLGMGERTCALTPMGDQPALTLGDGCDDVEARLHVPNGGTIWLSLTISDQPDLWLSLDTVAGDPAPPELDQRGRYFGCTQADDQVCQVEVEIESAAYQVAIPLMVDTAGST